MVRRDRTMCRLQTTGHSSLVPPRVSWAFLVLSIPGAQAHWVARKVPTWQPDAAPGDSLPSQ